MAGKNVEETAKEIGVARSTLSVWKTEPEFTAQLKTARGLIISAATKSVAEEIAEGAAAAPRVLIEIMNDLEQPAATRVLAAKDLLDRGGYKPPDKLELRKQFDGMSPDEVVAIATQRLLKGR